MDAIPISAYLEDKPDGVRKQTGATSISQADDNKPCNK